MSLALVVGRAPDDWLGDDKRHRAIRAGPRPRAILDHDTGRPLIPGFDPDNEKHWQALGQSIIAYLGQLARIQAQITPDLYVVGAAHRCDQAPWPTSYDRAPEIPAGNAGEGCHAYLSRCIDPTGAIDAGDDLPALYVVVPRDRERAWTNRLRALIRDLEREIAATQSEGASP